MTYSRPSKARLALLAALAGVAALISGCIAPRPYHTTIAPRPDAQGVLPPVTGTAAESSSRNCRTEDLCIQFVEYDEFGNLFNRKQLKSALEAAKRMAEQEQGTVFVYVHGWHHNAHPSDEDVNKFHELLQHAASLDKLTFDPNRKNGKGRFLGIYVGWRGESIRSKGILTPISVLTFWGRKSAAHAVGSGGGVLELFRELSAVRQSNSESRLLIMGHSFGGAVVYSSMAHALVEQILSDSRRADKDRINSEPLSDLVVVINPAFEAMKLRPQFELARSHEYPEANAPRLVILTTETDWATGLAFPAGRWLSTIGDRHSDPDSSSQNVKAVGHYFPFVTHQLRTTTTCPTEKGADSSLADVVRPKSYCFNALKSPSQTIRRASPVVLTRCEKSRDCDSVARGHWLERGPIAEGKIPFGFPIMNVRTTGQVMDGHSGNWDPTLQSFISQLLVLALRNPAAIPTRPLGPLSALPSASAKFPFGGAGFQN